jgi:hypothetical protein
VRGSYLRKLWWSLPGGLKEGEENKRELLFQGTLIYLKDKWNSQKKKKKGQVVGKNPPNALVH